MFPWRPSKMSKFLRVAGFMAGFGGQLRGGAGVHSVPPRRAVAFAHADDLNRKRNAADKTAGANQGGTAMLAEIFMLRLEAAARAAKEAANSSRFVPITLPSAKAS